MPSDAKDRWILATLAAITTVTAVVSSLGAPLVPSIATSYAVPLSTAQWVLTATMLAAAATTPALGRWGSGRLRRPVVLGGLAAVLVGLVLSALPTGIGGLLVGRALQGVGLALAPLTLAVARDLWRGERLSSRLSLLSVATVAGAGLGYPVTALVAEHAGVAGAYWFGAALVAATFALALRFLPHQAHGESQQVDLTGVALVAVGMVSVLLAVSQGDHWGWTSPATVSLAATGVVLVAAWVAQTRRVTRRGGQPLVDLALASRPGVLGPNGVAFTLGVGMYGLLTLVVLLVRADGSRGWGLDLGVSAAGLVLLPYALTSVAGSRVALRIARRRGPHVLLPTGCAVFASSMVLLAVAHNHLWQALVVMAVGGLGSGFTFSSLATLIVPQVPATETGSAMAFNQLLRYLGFAVGSAASVALLAVYGADLVAFRATSLTLAGVCLVAGLGVLQGRRGSGPVTLRGTAG
ncbi:MFS transporter [Nocardioides ferulae]|uniref:MFS transporter n=1 Tax=Nocardioides ferulae TaxID=2340821 RepID=UPI0013DDA081|nr:MFS transporter [Nocardioides ferulae]